MRKIDAHVHIYERINGYGYRGELRPIGGGMARWANGDLHRLIPESIGGTGFEARKLIDMMDGNGVEKAVILQGNLYGFQNEYIKEAMQAYPDRLVGACAVDPFIREGRTVLQHWLDAGFHAAKFEFSDACGLMSFHDPFPLDGERMLPYYQLLEENDAVLVVDIGSVGMNSYQPEAIAHIADLFPNLHIVVCHLLAHKQGEGELLAQELEMLRKSNIWFDISSVPWNTGEEYPFVTAVDYIRMAKELLGAEKLLWGSDLPGVILQYSYQQLTEYLDKSEEFTRQEKEDIFYYNAANVYFQKE